MCSSERMSVLAAISCRPYRLTKRYADKDSGSGTRLRRNGEKSIRQFSALAHAVQAQTGFHCGCIKASAGICDTELERLPRHRQLHFNIDSVCMLGDVSQGFLSDPVKTSPNTPGNVIRQLVRTKPNRNSFAL